MLQFERELADDEPAQIAISWIQQSGFTTRFFYDRMMVYAPNGSVGAECFNRSEIIAFARRQSPSMKPAMAAEPSPAQIRDLEETVRFLRERWRLAVALREEWEHRAIAAEREVAEMRAAAGASGANHKYQQLRRFIALEFHPDHAPPSRRDAPERAELFKILWAEISKIDKG